LIVPPDEVKLKASVIQAAFRDLDWIAPPPEHFLHVSVWVGATDELSIGYARRSEAADPLRTALRPFREVDLGTGIVDEVLLCDVPVAKSTFLRPWRLIGSVTLDGQSFERN
jgi:hypothetical protein